MERPVRNGVGAMDADGFEAAGEHAGEVGFGNNNGFWRRMAVCILVEIGPGVAGGKRQRYGMSALEHHRTGRNRSCCSPIR